MKRSPANGTGKGHVYKVREKAFLLFGRFCKMCRSSENLNLHHVDANFKNNNPTNWQILCASCHKLIHSKYFELTQEQKKELQYKQRQKWQRENRTLEFKKPNGYLNSWEACEFLKISRERLHQLKNSGKISFVKFGKRKTFYKKKDVEKRKNKPLTKM